MVENRKAYTLIELIVVIGIASVVFGMVLASFDTFGSGEKLNQETQLFKSKIDEIVKKVSSGDMEGYASCAGGQTCDSTRYELVITSSNSYKLQFYCKCPGKLTYELPISVYDLKLNEQITFTIPSGPFIISKDQQLTEKCITLNGSGRSKYIKFSYPGNVIVDDNCP